MLAAVVVVPLLLSLLFELHAVPPDQARDASGSSSASATTCSILTDWDFWVAFGRTVLLLTVALNLEMLLGLGLALLVEKATRGQRVLRTIMMFPMMFSPILVGFQFKFMFNDNIGLVNNALQSLGLTDSAIPWLIDGNLAFIAILDRRGLVVDLGLRDPDPGRPAGHAAASRSRRRASTAARRGRRSAMSRWPFVMPFAFIAMTIRSLDVARAYDIVKIMTDGGPAERTELLWTLVGAHRLQRRQMGLANAMAYFSILLSILFTVYFYRKLAAARTQIGAEW